MNSSAKTISIGRRPRDVYELSVATALDVYWWSLFLCVFAAATGPGLRKTRSPMACLDSDSDGAAVYPVGWISNGLFR